ncbi:CoF synthetase [Flagellimonas aquimarina]|uniref:CoF synthetase n=1 Tax=Flagellimonas aquimarina TaxID=2201895 RepID=A0A316KU46_9FLAO|nr:phenylacetate--CoA ligase family protein [Allomuricauda koreensis]PWL37712.1 CoF synthetase [Allomuricauda koreensis]
MKNNLPSKLRYLSFWALDAFKGGKVLRELKDIRRLLTQNSFDSLQKKNEIRLYNLLDKVTQETPFYSTFKNYESLQDFPVINKHIIKENFDELQIASSRETKLHSIFTSGSTGTPFMVYQTRRKRHRNTADTIYFAGKAGYTIGDKLLYLRLWNKNLKKKKISAYMQNIDQINIEDLNSNYIEALLIKLQKDKSPKGWLAYPSGLEKICDYLDSINSKPLNCNVKSIIGMSENLSSHVRSKMSHYFNTPMVSRYSNFENGIIAQQRGDSNYFEINWASYVLEVLDFEKDVPVKAGNLGRIVITDLYNHATPMIRYDTGDIGALTDIDNHTFPMLKTVEGRKADILFNTKGAMISPFKFMGILPQYPEIEQVQFIQTKKTAYIIKINVKGEFLQEMKLVALFKSIVGSDAELKVEYVDEIPLLSSKKRKITRNLYSEQLLQNALDSSFITKPTI